MTHVILNADDFGKSIQRNRAIDDSFKQGLINSSGLIVTGKHLQDAVQYMIAGGYVNRVHLHINLSANLLHEDSDDIPLTEPMRRDQFFCKDGQFSLYKGLPRRFSSISKWRLVYNEIVAQYEKFVEVTCGNGDNKHLDFHLWYNLTWPVALALNIFTRRYKIRSVRYIGVHQMRALRYRAMRILSWNPRVKCIPATNIDFFLSKKDFFRDVQLIELYCHPNYKQGILLDDSPSYLHHERRPLIEQIDNLKETGDLEFVSWEEV